MNFNEYQDAAAETAKGAAKGDSFIDPEAILFLANALQSESGEVGEKVKKFYREVVTYKETDGEEGMPKVAAAEKYLDPLGGELGDVLWYWARLADEVKYDADYVASKNLHKLSDREERGVILGDGDNR